jgi:hypothetical protein
VKKLRALAFCGFCIPAYFALVTFQEVFAACQIYWVSQPTCDNAEVDRTFSYQLGTRCVWDGVNQWTLHLAFTPGNSPNISNGSVLPATQTVNQTRDYFSTNSGTLTSPATCGNFQTSAWDGTYFMCAGAYDVTIRVNGATCTAGC